jgi:hypothetical protein
MERTEAGWQWSPKSSSARSDSSPMHRTSRRERAPLCSVADEFLSLGPRTPSEGREYGAPATASAYECAGCETRTGRMGASAARARSTSPMGSTLEKRRRAKATSKLREQGTAYRVPGRSIRGFGPGFMCYRVRSVYPGFAGRCGGFFASWSRM